MLLRVILISYLLLMCLEIVKGKCRSSFTTFCESVTDISTYGNRKWTSLYVVDLFGENCELPSAYEPNEALDVGLFGECVNLEHLSIVGKLNEIKPNAFSQLINLHNLQLHKNELRVLQKNTFSGLRQLYKLELSGNAVENIAHGFLQNSMVKYIDFSDNRLTNLQVDQLTIPSLKKLVLRNNLLSFLAVGCFHKNLEYLDMDSNELANINLDVVKNLENLRTIILSNNNITHVIPIPALVSLEELDLSHNAILTIERASFAKLPELRRLHLGYNKVIEFNGNIFPKYSKVTNLYLHMNYLTSLPYDVGENLHNVKEVSLGGNPWICKCLQDIRNYLSTNKISYPHCDKLYFGSGNTPVCIFLDRECNSTQPITNVLSEANVLEFRALIKDYECL